MKLHMNMQQLLTDQFLLIIIIIIIFGGGGGKVLTDHYDLHSFITSFLLFSQENVKVAKWSWWGYNLIVVVHYS